MPANSIYLSVEDCILNHSCFSNKQPYSGELQNQCCMMTNTLNRNLVKLSEWDQINSLNIRVTKIQMHSMKALVWLIPTTLDILRMKRQNDIHWTEHVFEMLNDAIKGLGFLKQCKNTSLQSDIGATGKIGIQCVFMGGKLQ